MTQDERMFEDIELWIVKEWNDIPEIYYNNTTYYAYNTVFNKPYWSGYNRKPNSECLKKASPIDKVLHSDYITSFITWFKSSQINE